MMRRITTALLMMLLAAATIGVAQPADDSADTPPSSIPTTLSTTTSDRDWFGRARPGLDDPTLFATLFPNLAAADPALRAVAPRIVFNAMGTKNQPRPMLLPPMHVSYHPFTDASKERYKARQPGDPWQLVPDERKIRMAAIDGRRIGAAGICIDVEEYPLDARRASDAEIDRSVRAIAQMVGWIRAQDPSAKVFMYAFMPHAEPWLGHDRMTLATTRPSGDHYAWWQGRVPEIEKRYETWRSANARLRAGPDRPVGLAELFDGVCPSLYYHEAMQEHADPIGIARALAWQHLDEARLYGRPIYPFVSPRFYGKESLVPLRTWTALIRELMIHGDGAILWDGHASVWSLGVAVRVRAVALLAEKRGEMSDRELFDQLKKEFPGSDELDALLDERPR